MQGNEERNRHWSSSSGTSRHIYNQDMKQSSGSYTIPLQTKDSMNSTFRKDENGVAEMEIKNNARAIPSVPLPSLRLNAKKGGQKMTSYSIQSSSLMNSDDIDPHHTIMAIAAKHRQEHEKKRIREEREANERTSSNDIYYHHTSSSRPPLHEGPNDLQDNDSLEASAKRRRGRKNMNYSEQEKRARNRSAVQKCRQRKALKYDSLQQRAYRLEAENQQLATLLHQNASLEESERRAIARSIQMSNLMKMRDILMQSLPKDLVAQADSLWELNAILTVSMPSRCHYGIDKIKSFWHTSLRMKNKGKIHSFWAWLFALPPGERFTEFSIKQCGDVTGRKNKHDDVDGSIQSNMYIIQWTTKSVPAFSGAWLILFGRSHRVLLHVECFGWLIWRYLVTHTPFPSLEMYDNEMGGSLDSPPGESLMDMNLRTQRQLEQSQEATGMYNSMRRPMPSNDSSGYRSSYT